MGDKRLYILAGPNGAGKTTAAQYLLPDEWQCREFVNADEIARGLSPFNAQAQAMQAGRLMLGRIEKLLSGDERFAFETTLATRFFAQVIAAAKANEFRVHIMFLALMTPAQAKSRVEKRVREGGHDIAPEVIERRFYRGLHNFFSLYKGVVDSWELYDNSGAMPAMIASQNAQLQPEQYEQLKQLGGAS